MTVSRFEVTPQSVFLRILLPMRPSLLAQVALPILGHFLSDVSLRKLALATFLISYSAAHSVDYLPPFPFRFPRTFLSQSPNVIFALACALAALWPRLSGDLRLPGWAPPHVFQLRLFSALALAGMTVALYCLAEYLRDRRDEAVDLEDAFPSRDQAFL